MSSTFDTSLDSFTDPAASDAPNSPSHSAQHININDAVEKLEAKVGVSGSAVTTSHDYKLSGVTSSDKAVSKTGTETLTNKTMTAPVLNNPAITGHKVTYTSDSDGATITFDLDAGPVHTVTLGDNRTLAVSNSAVGKSFTIILLQDGTGSRTVTWFSSIKWPGNVVPTLTTTASKRDVFQLFCYATDSYLGFTIGQTL